MVSFFKELLFWMGLAAIFYGVYLIYIPAAFIICGVFILWLVTPTVKVRQHKPAKSAVLG